MLCDECEHTEVYSFHGSCPPLVSCNLPRHFSPTKYILFCCVFVQTPGQVVINLTTPITMSKLCILSISSHCNVCFSYKLILNVMKPTPTLNWESVLLVSFFFLAWNGHFMVNSNDVLNLMAPCLCAMFYFASLLAGLYRVGYLSPVIGKRLLSLHRSSDMVAVYRPCITLSPDF